MADNDDLHVDPICGMEVNEENAAGKSEYKEVTYYFCSSICKDQFDLDPAKYAISVVPKT